MHEWKIKNRVAAKEQAGDACCTVPWSKGQDTGLSSRRYWVRAPWGSSRLLSLKVRTPASQAGNDEFKVYAPLRTVLDVVHRTTAPRRSYCGHRIMEIKQIVALHTGVRFPLMCTKTLFTHGWVCLAARAADCKSVTQKHRRFESCPIHFPFACPRGLWCHPAKVACGNAPKVRILPQTLQGRDGIHSRNFHAGAAKKKRIGGCQSSFLYFRESMAFPDCC